MGFRLAPGLHLGHYVGNIKPAIEDNINFSKPINIILADDFTYSSLRKQDITLENTLSIVAECYALGLWSDNISFIIQSELSKNIHPLLTIIGGLLKYNKLIGIQPTKKILESKFNPQYSSISFPLVQCAEMFSTKCNVLYSNIDNLGLISFAKSLAHQLSTHTGIDFIKPSLRHGTIPMLHGTDGVKKMAFAQKNTISICEEPSEIKMKIKSIKTDRLDITYNSPDFSLILEYFAALSYNSDTQDLINLYNQRKLTALDIKMILADHIISLFNTAREFKKNILQNERDVLINRILLNTQMAKLKVKQFCTEISETFYQKDYFNLLLKPML